MSFSILRVLGLVAIALIALAVTAPASALAQSFRHPPLVDLDEGHENYSEFWQQAIRGQGEKYRELLAQAKSHYAVGDEASQKQATELLQSAIALDPKHPEAHYLMGSYEYERTNWEACANAFKNAYQIDPSFRPAEMHRATDLDFNLATCLLFAGDYEGAIIHCKRIVALSYKSNYVVLRLGEAYMALGRLEEAIEALEGATTQNYEVYYALAVALDRAEKLSRSREVLSKATGRDGDLMLLRSADKHFAPAADEDYYLGLAYAQQHKDLLALFHFRRYLQRAPDSPWTSRVASHLTKLKDAEIGSDLLVRGGWDYKKLQTAIAKQAKPLQGCLNQDSRLKGQVEIRLSGGDRSVKASVSSMTDLSRSELVQAVECLERVARAIKTPPHRLPKGSSVYVNASFSVIAASE